ncbi:hypothetical protein [Streptomyces sp. NBC_00078]|uniref:hypothetical protein n=1 Tax=unclassified Streptomyces TaxID=2593676 RepID=UPI002255C080|nr:hypothetical protein [Streptomyces sp. NBC_00078]MCX5420787.1 hypothetical protein [Streptomyces sp. NBC_00078]
MKLLKTRRLLVAASVVAAAGVVPLLTATSASADQIGCTKYLANHHYTVGPKVRAACNIEHLPVGANPVCVTALVNLHVKLEHASAACRLA